jgi:hypothetical protein
MQIPTQQLLEATLKNIYYRLTDEEIEARKERKDEFFIAVRKKHGIARAQAELFLHDLEQQFYEAAA